MAVELGNSVTVARLTLDQLVQVRILVPQWFDAFALRFHKGLAHHGPEQERSEAAKASKASFEKAVIMTDALGYFFLFYVFALFLLGIRGAYLDFKLMRYLRNNYPEKAREFGCPKGGWFNGFKFSNALYKEHNVSDPYFLSLKNKAKNTQTLVILLLLLPFSLFLILILVGSLL